MDAGLLKFTDSGVSNGNIALDAIKAQLYTVVDSKGAQIWKFVGRGIGLPSYSEADPLTVLDVRGDQAPCVVMFDDMDEHVSRTVQWSDTELIVHVRLQFFIELLGSDSGAYPSVQTLRRNITRATLRALRPISIDNPTGMPDPTLINGQFPWWIEEPQSAPVSYKSDLNDLFPIAPVAPPWWTWHLNIAIRATNV